MEFKLTTASIIQFIHHYTYIVLCWMLLTQVGQANYTFCSNDNLQQ